MYDLLFVPLQYKVKMTHSIYSRYEKNNVFSNLGDDSSFYRGTTGKV